MEIFPKVIYNKSQEEENFYKEIFDSCEFLIWNNEVLEKAKTIAERYGLSAMDAFHIAFALEANVDEFITSERPNKPIFRVEELRVINIEDFQLSFVY